QLDAEPRRSLADSSTNLGRVLANACGEHQSINATERRRECSDLFGGTIDEILDRELRSGLVALEKITHVVADAGYSEQARFLVKHPFDFFRRQSEPLKEVQHDTRIERSGPRAHAESIKSRKPEAAVDAPAVLQRTKNGPLPRWARVTRPAPISGAACGSTDATYSYDSPWKPYRCTPP